MKQCTSDLVGEKPAAKNEFAKDRPSSSDLNSFWIMSIQDRVGPFDTKQDFRLLGGVFYNDIVRIPGANAASICEDSKNANLAAS
jgi:hypothetical protein